jgi:hypothetical protein
MSPRRLKVIFSAFTVLVVAYAIVQLLSRDGRQSGGDEMVAAVADGFGVVRMVGPEAADSVQLEEKDGAWTVNGYPADTSLVRQLAEGLDTARVGRLVARNAANHARLGIAEESAWRIEIGPAGDPAVTFLLGGEGPDGRYARFPPSDEVFAVPIASVRLLTRSAEEWRDRIVVAADTSVIRRIAVRRKDQPAPVILARGIGDSGAFWNLDGTAADTAAVQALLRESANLTATGFPSDSVVFAVDFGSPDAVLEMFDSDAPYAAPTQSLLFLAAPDAPDILVRRADAALTYRISGAQARRLLPPRQMLLPQTTE